MPIKHQSDCYRTFNGVRFPNLCDIMDDVQLHLVEARQRKGHRIRIRTHPDGYKQAFIHPDDIDKPF